MYMWRGATRSKDMKDYKRLDSEHLKQTADSSWDRAGHRAQ